MIFNFLAFINFAIFRNNITQIELASMTLFALISLSLKANKIINLICLLEFEILGYKNKQK